MQLEFRNTKTAKDTAKRLKKAFPDLKHCRAQEIVARLFGYSNWHHFHHACEANSRDGNLDFHFPSNQAAQRREILADRLSGLTGITLKEAESLLPGLVPCFLIDNKLPLPDDNESDTRGNR